MEPGTIRHEPELTIDVFLQMEDAYSPFDRNPENVLRWILVIAAAFIVYDVCFRWPERGPLIATNPLCVVMVVLLAFLVIQRLVVPYLRLRKIFHNSPGFHTTVRYWVNSSRLRFESRDAKAEYAWSAFARVIETQKAFALAQTDYSGTYLPKRCFASAEQVVAFRTLVRENFKGRQNLFSR